MNWDTYDTLHNAADYDYVLKKSCDGADDLCKTAIVVLKFEPVFIPFFHLHRAHKTCIMGWLSSLVCKEIQIVYRLFLVNCYLLHENFKQKQIIEVAWQYT